MKQQHEVIEMSTELATRQESSQSTAITPLDMLNSAMQRGMTGDDLSKFMDLHQRWEADQARKAYVQAMAAFKAEPLRVGKGKHVEFTTQKGTTKYDHATLAQVVDAVVAAMSRHGLSHRWTTGQQDKNITVSCVITHALGHSETTTLTAAPDDSGGKNSIQAIGSTVSYLQRYTLMAATGLAAHDMDNDARTATPPIEYISESEAADLDALAEEVGADKAAFCDYMKIASMDKLPKSWLPNAVKILQKKRKAAK